MFACNAKSFPIASVFFVFYIFFFPSSVSRRTGKSHELQKNELMPWALEYTNGGNKRVCEIFFSNH